ncbi:hypothetical protein ANCDUO_24350, partial [Ancylostoma duodenale]
MWLLACVLALLICVNAGDSTENEELPQFDVESGVYILHDKDFDDFVKTHPTFLAKFYAPWSVFHIFGPH